MLNVLKNFFGTPNDRVVRKLRTTVDEINALEPEYEALSDKDLKAKTDFFKSEIV